MYILSVAGTFVAQYQSGAWECFGGTCCAGGVDAGGFGWLTAIKLRGLDLFTSI
jgi:hypothetical protein